MSVLGRNVDSTGYKLLVYRQILTGRVLYRIQKQPPRRGGGAGDGAGTGGEDAGDILSPEKASAYLEHGSYQVANHVMQKAIATDAVDKKLAGLGLALFP